MNTLLVVEDEKMIRQGIVVMLKRTGVPIGKIIECRNGQEALDVIRTEKVDALFTDIKMPKMDGIALVNALQSEKDIPLIAVISGYDDFNYAVAMLKNGVMDYILKPIKREKILEVVLKMEEMLKKKKRHRQNNEKIVEQQFQELITENENVLESTGVWNSLCEMLGSTSLSVAIAESKEDGEAESVLSLKDSEGQNVLLYSPADRERVKTQLLEMSIDCLFSEKECRNAAELTAAYYETRQARYRKFVYGGNYERYQENEFLPLTLQNRRELAEKFAQQLPTRHFEKALHDLENMYFQASHGKYEAEEIISLNRNIWEELKKNYPELAKEKRDILSFHGLEQYIKYEHELLEQMKQELQEKMDVDINQEKVYQAIEYIQQNYQKDLDMATVSNYVSMNYSLFSIVFKEYTGVNFVNYLKNLRIREAKKLLETTDDKIQEISRKVGYENEKHFMKTFKMLCGVSPSEYRKGKMARNDIS